MDKAVQYNPTQVTTQTPVKSAFQAQLDQNESKNSPGL